MPDPLAKILNSVSFVYAITGGYASTRFALFTIGSLRTWNKFNPKIISHFQTVDISGTKRLQTMAVAYAKDQPEGFTNRIENVAIVGVRRSLHLVVNPPDIAILRSLIIQTSGRRVSWETSHRPTSQKQQAHRDRHHPPQQHQQNARKRSDCSRRLYQ